MSIPNYRCLAPWHWPEFTVINWEVRGKVPRIKNLRERLTREVEGVGKWLYGNYP